MKSSLVLALVWGLLMCIRFSSICEGADKIKEGQKSSRVKNRTMVVHIDDSVDVQKLLDGRITAIYDCIRVLKDPYDPSSFKAKEKRHSAISLLGVLRASDHQEAIQLLVKDVDFHCLLSFSSDYPLLGFTAAEAIVKIGSPALGELLKSLEPKRTEDELRLVAFIIERVDGRDLGRCRIDLEIKRILAIWPHLREEPDAHMNNLLQLQKWFADAEFFAKEANWPYRTRSRK